MEIGEVSCKTVINSSGIEGVDYAVNPYIGCGHACTYCYARFMTRWYHKGEKWGTFVDVKKNAVEVFEKEAGKRRKGVIMFSSVTDAYQPVEKKYEITRKMLKILTNHDYPIQLLTKSSLISRDLEIISKIDEVEVGFTLTSYDDGVRKAFELGASTVEKRLRSLKEFSDAGIPTYAFLGPILPYIGEKDIEELLNHLADSVGRVLVDRLNIKAGNWKAIEETLREHYPDIVSAFREASRKPSEYYENLRRIIGRELSKRAIPFEILF